MYPSALLVSFVWFATALARDSPPLGRRQLSGALAELVQGASQVATTGIDIGMSAQEAVADQAVG